MRNLLLSKYILTLCIVFVDAIFNAYPVYAEIKSSPPNRFDPNEIDEVVVRSMDRFQVPGMAVGVIKDGEVVHSKGYGVLEFGRDRPVDEKTLFSIASTGKAFTAAAIALLVDEGRISWNDKVISHLPQFQMYDPWVTREFQVRDLLIHNSGLSLGAGDLMFFPTEGFTREEIIRNLRFLKPETSFRSKYAYDNLLYIVAGELIATVAKMSYEDFVDNRILKPLKMNDCGANLRQMGREKNVAKPHVVANGEPMVTENVVKLGGQTVSSAAGGIVCSVDSMLLWLDMLLRDGELEDGRAFLSRKQHSELMSPQILINVDPTVRGHLFKTSLAAYGLGWIVSEHNGYKKLWHTGSVWGMVSVNVLIPELNLGIVVYSNQQMGPARIAIVSLILEMYTSTDATDWVSLFDRQWKKQLAENAIESAVRDVEVVSPMRPLEEYTGRYQDAWFGEVEIRLEGDALYFESARSEKLKGRIVPHRPDVFIVTWDDRTLEADAFLMFKRDSEGRTIAISMKSVSPLTDFSYDFHHLNLQRVAE